MEWDGVKRNMMGSILNCFSFVEKFIPDLEA